MDRQSRYTELLHRHLPMVWRMCWVRARGDYERCRDLVQEVSIALWLHLDVLRTGISDKEERAWVRWQTRTTLDHMHRSQRPPMLALTEAMVDTIPDGDSAAAVEDIEHLMAVLSSEEQQLVRMHIEGYRADEIATILGLRRDAVYQRMHRALGKARKAMLVVILLFVVSTVAVAVVPQWRQRVFGGGEAEDTVPVSIPAATFPVQPQVDSGGVDSLVPRRVWLPREPVPHLTVADTLQSFLEPCVVDPCGCPDSVRGTANPCISVDEEPDLVPEEEMEVTVMVMGNNIVVEGVRDERVDVYDGQGRLVATARCSDHCVLTIGMQDHSYSRTNTGANAYWVQVGDRPRQQVFIGQMLRANPTNPFPTLPQRVLMF